MKTLALLEPLEVAVPNGGTGYSVLFPVGMTLTVSDQEVEDSLLEGSSVVEHDTGEPAGTE